MTEASRAVIIKCLRSEIAAFELSLSDRGPHYDYFGMKQFDVREDYLAKLRRALVEMGSA